MNKQEVILLFGISLVAISGGSAQDRNPYQGDFGLADSLPDTGAVIESGAAQVSVTINIDGDGSLQINENSIQMNLNGTPVTPDCKKREGLIFCSGTTQ